MMSKSRDGWNVLVSHVSLKEQVSGRFDVSVGVPLNASDSELDILIPLSICN